MRGHRAVVLGAGAAGTAAARTLAGGEGLEVLLIDRTGEVPYNRMLIKQVAFGRLAPDLVMMPNPPARLCSDTAASVDPSSRTVRLASGDSVGFDRLIVATGSAPRRWSGSGPAGAAAAAAAGVLTALHSLRDAVRIRDTLRSGSARVVIFGAGLTASETASALAADGHRVTLVTRSTRPGESAFGEAVAAQLAQAHHRCLDTRFGRTPITINAGAASAVVQLDDGTDIEADLAILAHGTMPAAPAPWSDQGVEVDDRLRSTTYDGIYAAGGVAVHHDDHLGTWRIDHWDDGAAQGEHVARTVMHDLGQGADPGPYRPRSTHVAMIHGHAVSGVGFIGAQTNTRPIGTGPVHLHEHRGLPVGASGVDAVAAVYRWAPLLHLSPTGPQP